MNHCDVGAFLLMQDMVAATGQVRAVASSPAVVSVANLTQVQVAQRLASANLVSQSPTVVTTVVTKGKHMLNPSLLLATEIHLLFR
jgi:hypothetical protein